jgi:hypothetical protein
MNSHTGFPPTRSRSNSPAACRPNSPGGNTGGRKLNLPDTSGFIAPKKHDGDDFEIAQRKKVQPRTTIGVDIDIEVDMVRGLR